MAKFSFQLEGVLQHRLNIERQHQRRLAEFQRHMATLEDELKQLDRSNQAALEELRRDHLVGVIDLEYLAAHRRFTAAAGRKAVVLAQRIALAQRDIDSARQALAQAAVQRKIIEKLRERHFEAWKTRLARIEAAEIDEIGSQIAYRQLAKAEMSCTHAGEP